MHLGAEPLVGMRLRHHAEHRHVFRQPPVQLNLPFFDAPAVLRHAHPGDVDMALRVCVSALVGDEVRQLVDNLPIVLQLHAPGVIDRQRHPLPGVLASLPRHWPPLSGSGELALKHLVDQRTLPDPGATRDQYVEPAYRPLRLFHAATDHRQDVLRPRQVANRIVRNSHCCSSPPIVCRQLTSARHVLSITPIITPQHVRSGRTEKTDSGAAGRGSGIRDDLVHDEPATSLLRFTSPRGAAVEVDTAVPPRPARPDPTEGPPQGGPF